MLKSKSVYSYFFILLLSLSFIKCTDSTNYVKYYHSKKNKKDLLLKKVGAIQINVPDSIELGEIWRFTTNRRSSRLAFFDNTLQRIIVTDKNGNFLYKVGDKGRGPGEFLQILSWSFDEHNNLVVYDEAQRKIVIFGPEGILKKEFSIMDNQDLVASSRKMYANDSTFYMGIIQLKFMSRKWKSKMISTFSYNGKLRRLFGKYDKYIKEAPHYIAAPLFSINFNRNKLYASHKNSYRVQIFNLQNGKRIAYFGYQSPHYKISNKKIRPSFPRNKIFRMIVNQSITSYVGSTSNYIITHFVNTSLKSIKTHTQRYQEHFITVYSKTTHNFLAEMKLPAPLVCINNNKLYLLENMNPTNYSVGIYEIQMDS